MSECKINGIMPQFVLQSEEKSEEIVPVVCLCCDCEVVDCICPEECFHPSNVAFVRQSEEVEVQTSTGNAGASEESQQTVNFIDEVTGLQVGIPTPVDPVASTDEVSAADLKGFLSRPVRIDSFTWSETDASDIVKRTVYPWQAFFNDARIKYKLNNFGFIRCNLKVKVIINASPFYYGCMGMAYQPLQNLTPSTIVLNNGQQTMIPFSQRPIVWMYAQDSAGGEMTLPFFYHKNWLKIGISQHFQDMGQLDFLTYTTLQSANGVAGQGVTVQIYAWAEDVQLSASTVGLALQSSETEYGTGPVSAPATAIASAARMLRSVPYIGKFANATEIGAKAVAGIASLFGYTNVPVIEDTKPLQPRAFPMFASPEIGYPCEKLTLDPKNELSIDNSITGTDAQDPLAIDRLVQHESFLVRTTWATTNVTDDILFYSRVNPWLYRSTGTAQNSFVDFTPLAYVSRLFNDWRGDIIFRFKIIASPYHKGRLLIAFDPQGTAGTNLVNTTNTTSAVYTQIVDLGDTNDVEIRVPYQQALAFLQTRQSTDPANSNWSTSATPTWNVNDDLDNGCIVLRVLTALTAPVATAPVSILCFVRGTDNMEFANPIRVDQALVPYQVQSTEQEVSREGQQQLAMGKGAEMAPHAIYRVNFGECTRSLRPLLHRANLAWVYRDFTNANAANSMSIAKFRFGKLPPYGGFDPNGIHTATALVGVGTKPYNFVDQMPVHWILPAFVGYRGSGVWTFNALSGGNVPLNSIRVNRTPGTPMVMSESYQTSSAITRSIAASYMVQNTLATAGGCALTNQQTNAGLSVLCPNYNNYRFNSTAPGNTTVAPNTGVSAYDGSDYDCFNYEVTLAGSQYFSAGMAIEKYWHAGPDFNPVFFLNVPTRYVQVGYPVAV